MKSVVCFSGQLTLLLIIKDLFVVTSRPYLSGLTASNTQIVIVEYCVKQKRETAVRLMTPHRVIGEHHNVALSYRYVDHCRTIS